MASGLCHRPPWASGMLSKALLGFWRLAYARQPSALLRAMRLPLESRWHSWGEPQDRSERERCREEGNEVK